MELACQGDWLDDGIESEDWLAIEGAGQGKALSEEPDVAGEACQNDEVSGDWLGVGVACETDQGEEESSEGWLGTDGAGQGKELSVFWLGVKWLGTEGGAGQGKELSVLWVGCDHGEERSVDWLGVEAAEGKELSGAWLGVDQEGEESEDWLDEEGVGQGNAPLSADWFEMEEASVQSGEESKDWFAVDGAGQGKDEDGSGLGLPAAGGAADQSEEFAGAGLEFGMGGKADHSDEGGDASEAAVGDGARLSGYGV